MSLTTSHAKGKSPEDREKVLRFLPDDASLGKPA
jgi:hypothetical protein